MDDYGSSAAAVAASATPAPALASQEESEGSDESEGSEEEESDESGSEEEEEEGMEDDGPPALENPATAASVSAGSPFDLTGPDAEPDPDPDAPFLQDEPAAPAQSIIDLTEDDTPYAPYGAQQAQGAAHAGTSIFNPHMPSHAPYPPAAAAAAAAASSSSSAAAPANSNHMSYLNRPPSMASALFGGKPAGGAGALPMSSFNPFASMRTPSSSPPAAAAAASSSSSSAGAASSSAIDVSAEEEVSDTKLGTILCLVFGMKMCPGKAAAKETVVLHRIHTGADSNAIRVDNVISQPCGVLNKDTAAALAPLIDNKLVRVEARVGTLTEQEMGLRIDLYGQAKERKGVERHLRKFPMVNYLSLHDPQPKRPGHAGLDAFLQAHGGAGAAAAGVGGAAGSASADGIGSGPSVREIESDLDSLFGAELDLALMPLAETPASLRTVLHPYQRQGLAWMIQHEERRIMNVEGKSELMMGWTKQTHADGRVVYYNQLTKESQADPPERERGGLLADEMGLGKCWGRGTRLLRFDGNVAPVEDIQEGDWLMGDDSTPREVRAGSLIHSHTAIDAARFIASPTQTMTPATYRVTMANSVLPSWTCNGDHILVLRHHARPTVMQQEQGQQDGGLWAAQQWVLETQPHGGLEPVQRAIAAVPVCASRAEAQHALDAWLCSNPSASLPLEWEMTAEQFFCSSAATRSHARMFTRPVDFGALPSCDAATGKPRALHARFESAMHAQGLVAKDAQWHAHPALVQHTAWVLGAWMGAGEADSAALLAPTSSPVVAHAQRWLDSVSHVAARKHSWGKEESLVQPLDGGLVAGAELPCSDAPASLPKRLNLGPVLLALLQSYGVLGDGGKHVPADLLTESAEVRSHLLAGWIDAAGARSAAATVAAAPADQDLDRAQIAASSERMQQGLLFLSRSVGLRTGLVKEREGGATAVGETSLQLCVEISGRRLSALPTVVASSGPHNSPLPRAQDDVDDLCEPFTLSRVEHADYFGFTLHSPGGGRCNGRLLTADLVVTHNTCQCLSLIASSLKTSSSSSSSSSSKFTLSLKGPRGGRASAPTLIVCPLSVITNWEQQLLHHFHPSHCPSHYTYHGPNRCRDVAQLRQYDVIITTYNILAQEFDVSQAALAADQLQVESDDDDSDDEFGRFKKKKAPRKQSGAGAGGAAAPRKKGLSAGAIAAAAALAAAAEQEGESGTGQPKAAPLFAIEFFRIILDEAHVIRERNTLQSRAARALRGERRWALSGTPLVNKVDDAFALLNFIRVPPFTSHQMWQRIVAKPLKQRDPKGMERLQQIMSTICLRRKKNEEINGKRILLLPDKVQRTRMIDLSGQEKLLYQTLSESGRSQFQRLLQSDSVLRHYAYVLEILLRMRQACDHSMLVPQHYHAHGFSALAGTGDGDRAAQVRRLVALLEEGMADECAVCRKQVEDPVITACCHYCCKKCLDAYMEQPAYHNAIYTQQFLPVGSPPPVADPRLYCPQCRSPLDKSLLVGMHHKELLRLEQEQKQAAALHAQGHITLSPKLLALLEELQRVLDAGDKAIVFSQFTSFLNILQTCLHQANVKHVRLDGQMSAANRAKALKAFEDDDGVKVFLISLKAGGVGLNLTAANHVFLMDPWWNPSTEDQAVDRVHRLGQTKNVEVVRFICRDSVEEKILDLQNAKREMTTTALTRASKSREDQQADRLQDLLHLFK